MVLDVDVPVPGFGAKRKVTAVVPEMVPPALFVWVVGSTIVKLPVFRGVSCSSTHHGIMAKCIIC